MRTRCLRRVPQQRRDAPGLPLVHVGHALVQARLSLLEEPGEASQEASRAVLLLLLSLDAVQLVLELSLQAFGSVCEATSTCTAPCRTFEELTILATRRGSSRSSSPARASLVLHACGAAAPAAFAAMEEAATMELPAASFSSLYAKLPDTGHGHLLVTRLCLQRPESPE